MRTKGIAKLFKNTKGIYIFIGKSLADKVDIPNKQRLIVEYDDTDKKLELNPL